MKTCYSDIAPFITKDGSEIRELLHPDSHAARNQSLAEATVLPGHRTHLHRHHRTEEIYHVTAGQGQMTLGEEVLAVGCQCRTERRKSAIWQPIDPVMKSTGQ